MSPPRPPAAFVPRVVVTRRLPEAVEHRLAQLFDTQLNRDDAPMTPAQLASALRDADAVIPTVSDRMLASVIADAAAAGTIRCRLLANFGVGFDHIDLEAARDAGILVTNTPDVLTEDVADLTIALMLMVMRRLGEGERQLRAGDWTGWRPTHMLGSTPHGKTIGIIGFGRIGRAVAGRARLGFGMRVIYFNPSEVRDTDRLESAAEPRDSIDAVLAESDVVSVHCRGMPETRNLIDARRLGLMKPGSFLVNTSRGDVVDEGALVATLRSGRLAGAGMDVYRKEPSVEVGLLQLDNVVLLPHLGSATLEARTAMGMRAVDNLVSFFDGKPPRDRVA